MEISEEGNSGGIGFKRPKKEILLQHNYFFTSRYLLRARTMSVTKAVSSLDDVVVKSPNDRRLYRVIELENGLSALLIHDPDIYLDGSAADGEKTDGDQMDEDDEDGEEEEDSDGSYEDDDDEEMEGDEDEVKEKGDHQTKKAAAAMCVAMGSFLDPPEAQGLAHFLEHMLFMGSTDFPDENEYDSYLSKHGGSSNAYTEMEHTCYHFEVKREFLRDALKRFSQFFVAPLMKTEAMERELLAVDSEFNQAIQNDACRLQQLQCHTSTKGHPLNRFAWGNKKSLSGAMENGVDLRECIVKLYKEYYHGGLMKLVVIGGEPLDLLESWVVELFGDVKNGSKIRPTLEAKGPIWEGGKLYRLEAVRDVHTLDLTWTLPPLRHAYVKKPEDYLAHLLGHEGRGSLHSFLKGKGWITSLSAGVGDDGINRSSLAYVFGMSIHLTDSGLEKIYDIIGYIYQYLKLLRDASPQEWIFKELQDIGNMDFRYAEEQAADDYAAELSGNMLAYPVEHVIYGDYVYQTWDPKMIEDLMGFFTPKNMRIDVVSKSVKSEEFQTEPWFGSRYVEEDVPLTLMETWSNPSEVDTSLHLPSKNQFIPCDFSIRAINSDADPKSQSPPKCLIDEPLMKFWYKLDETFKVPRANTYFRINLKGAYDSVKNCLLTELFINLLKDELNEIIYQASIAKLETSLSMYGDKLELKVYGFNEKIPALLSKILAIAKSFMPSLDRFKVIKENMERGFRNSNMKPLNHSTYLRLQLLCKRIYDSDEKLSVLNDLSLADLNSFISVVRSQIYIEALCHGNLSEDETINISNIFKNSLTVEPLPVKCRHGEQIMCFPLNAKLVRDVTVKNRSETNSVVELYYQIEPEEAQSTRMKAMLDLFHEIIGEPLFNQLRTKEQLGYVVECGPRLTYRVQGFCFCVQSSLKYHYRNTISISVAYLFLCLFITYVSSQSLIRQITDDVNTNLKEDVPYVQKHQEISSRHYNVSNSKTVTGMRNRRPSTYSYKIETNVVDKFETRPFTVGGYNWILHVYLNGNTKDGGAGYVSLYVEIDKSGFVDSAHQEVYADLRFYIFNRNERKYFTIQDTDVWRFDAFNTMWGFSKVLPVDTFKDPKNGYLYNGEHCEFGVDVIVPTPFEESETFSISSSSDKYTWTIQKFSTLSKDLYSPVISLGGKKWNILVVPAGSGSGRGKYVSMFLQLSTNQRRGYEYIYVRVKFRVINQSKLSNRESELRNWYGRTYSWGIVDLISFDDLRDSSKGFLVNDALIVEVQLEAISTTKYFP